MLSLNSLFKATFELVEATDKHSGPADELNSVFSRRNPIFDSFKIGASL